MAHLPQSVRPAYIDGLPLYRTGKVRDTYLLGTNCEDKEILLTVASDRISIFDFVLPVYIAQKGEILTAMNVFWRTKVFQDTFAHDLVAYGAGIDEHLPKHLHNNLELQKRSVVVEKLQMLPIEAIVRGYLTGSGFASYMKNCSVCGHDLPEQLRDGSRLPYAIFTPTTKAQEGHDEHINADSVAQEYGVLPERTSLQLYYTASRFARSKGIIIADTKFEFGFDADGMLMLGDEAVTPDCSRFWDANAWRAAMVSGNTSPPSLDKQYMREEGKRLGIANLDPRKPEDLAYVDSCEIASRVCSHTAKINRYIFSRLIGKKLEIFQRDAMGIAVTPPPVRIEIVLGSDSDLPQTFDGREFIHDARGVESHLHIISCHRNPEILRNYAASLPDNCIVIAAAGYAAALPGILHAWLNYFGKGSIPVLGVGLEGNTMEADHAARLSIEQLPGNPVIMPGRHAYFGHAGFLTACVHAIENEFLVMPKMVKDAQLNLSVLPEEFL